MPQVRQHSPLEEGAVNATAFTAREESPVAAEPTLVVGIGASAGGLEALERFFSHMPAETGLAFVVVQHLSPDFESLMDELLAQRTRLPIHRVENGMLVERDAVYLIPPKKEMIISAGRLLLTDKDPSHGLTLPIDQFFRSLAHDLGSRAAAVVLSGTGSDGSRGIRDVHNAGGLVIAQSEESAKFDGMPRSAIDTGLVDLVLPAEEIPAALLRHIQHPAAESVEGLTERPASEEGMQAIFRLLRQEYGIDFSHYKPSTVMRRTDRRLSLLQSLDLADYVERLKRDSRELNSLYRDLLIGVTSFFRDGEAFERLGDEIEELLRNGRSDTADFRVWIAGCATGEEAYSVAMLVHERLEALQLKREVKIFATDVHRVSLESASAGMYAESSLGGLTPERRERYFNRQGDSWQVSQELRQMIVFAPHNIIKDAPFTKLDLITCRNLLIYLQPLAQKKSLSLFHFGLRMGGLLFLGPSESPAELSDEFEIIDERWKIYRKRRDVRLPADLRPSLFVPGSPHRFGQPPWQTRMAHTLEGPLLAAYDAILAEYMPPGLLINEARELVHAFGGAEHFLHLRSGRPSADVLELVLPELRIALAGAIQRAGKQRGPVMYRALPLTEEGKCVNLGVRPLHLKSGGCWSLVTFEEMAAPQAAHRTETEMRAEEASRDRVESLEMELRYTKENLQATIEELETSNEELQATNEELVASNEELQSTNEELHSVNEELYTVNAEYQRKIGELTELTNDMENLLSSTEIGTIFLDCDLRIRKFTPHIGRAFDLLPRDVGRRIDTFSHNLHHESLLEDVASVLRTGQVIEREVRDHGGAWFFLRILPYRTKSLIEGVVLTLIDIGPLKRAQAQLVRIDAQFQGILQNSSALIFAKDTEGRYLFANRQCQLKLGVDEHSALGKTDFDLLPREIAERIREHDALVLQTGLQREFEEIVPGPTGPRTLLASKFPLRDEDGKIHAIGCVATDISRQKANADEQQEAIRRRDLFLAMLSHELRNPLGAILNAAHVLERGTDARTLPEAARVVTRQARQMARLLDDLLDVSRITQNKLELRKTPLDLRRTVQDAVETVQSAIAALGQSLIVSLPPEPVWVLGDEARLQQVHVNLLTNAARYTSAAGRIELVLAREGKEAVVRVRDNGVGIAPEMLESIFEMFVQAESPLDRAAGGMGVGLTLARSIVELHAGTIHAASEGPGRGSEFVVRLPLSEAASEATPVSSAAAPRSLKLLVVEDNEDSREMLTALLEFDGHEVLSAANGEDALHALHRLGDKPPDAALVDVGLPLLDGYEVARRIRANPQWAGLRLIALTGYGQPADREQALAAGFDEHLTKPLGPAALARVFASLEKNSRSS